ncbi:MAG TPA: UDP-N-acetylmuramate dehydrogenase [Candidatus Limnocylindria bacterium]|nr:UDP-N-acetylmuramate dehydrogenase [Candidatus Limnocylindria bacterium]
MQILENVILAPYTTFKIGGPAKFFCVVKDQFEALTAYEFAKQKNLKTLVLGGGSNILVSDKGFDGLVVKIVNKGIEIVSETQSRIQLRVASGEVWDEVVSFAVKNNWWGLENLSHIPGSTGAIAVQNVGAYGKEASEIIESVTVFNTESRNILNLSNRECNFTYRSSIFNSTQKGKYIIFYINFNLEKNGQANLSYRDLKAKFGTKQPSIGEVRDAVIEIRDTKFPFPTTAVKGNAGSFFKNPILNKEEYDRLKETIAKNFADAKAEELEKKRFSEGSQVKVPAAFLMDICQLKQLESGGAAINLNQPLVIINQSGQATAADVLSLANKVKAEVQAKTGIELKFEPELIGF